MGNWKTRWGIEKMIGNKLLSVVALLMLVVIFAALFWPNEPLSDRTELDLICNYYFKVLGTKGKLTSQQELELRQKLEDNGFHSIIIEIVQGKSHGSMVKLQVDVQKTYEVQKGLKRENVTMDLGYRNTTLCTMLEVNP